jgi:hypothetical protein
VVFLHAEPKDCLRATPRLSFVMFNSVVCDAALARQIQESPWTCPSPSPSGPMSAIIYWCHTAPVLGGHRLEPVLTEQLYKVTLLQSSGLPFQVEG